MITSHSLGPPIIHSSTFSLNEADTSVPSKFATILQPGHPHAWPAGSDVSKRPMN
nr:hypothetical protein [Labilithrix luteola]